MAKAAVITTVPQDEPYASSRDPSLYTDVVSRLPATAAKRSRARSKLAERHARARLRHRAETPASRLDTKEILVAQESDGIGSLAASLRVAGFGIRTYPMQPAAGWKRARGFSLAILGLKPNEHSIADLVASFREQHSDVPLLVVIGGESATLRVAAFESGADDAVAYPFALEELMVRARALLRRRRQTRLMVGDLTIDLGAVTVDRDGHPVHLSMSEFRLLAYLVRHEDEIVRRDELEAVVCRDRAGTRQPENLLQAFILKLRRKLEAGGRRPLVHTIHGVGYICSAHAPEMAKPRKPRR